jgi:hypothetical protein
MRKSKSLVNIFDALIYNGLRSHLPARSYVHGRQMRAAEVEGEAAAWRYVKHAS